MTEDRPLLGIMLMIGFCILAPIGDTIAKLLGGIIPLWQLLMVRFGMQALLLLPLVRSRAASVMTPRLIALMTLRTVLHLIGVGAMFTALRYLPLADCIAIAFVMPFIMLLLGRFVLGEEIGARRLAACTAGFIGTLLVIQPSFAEVGLPALLPVVVAFAFAFFMLTTRQMAKEVDPITLQAISGAMACAILGVLFVLFAGRADGAVAVLMPDLPQTALMLAIGVIGTVAHLLMVWSLRYAPSATVAPMQYLEIPFATLIGWIVFTDLPNGLAAVGIAITMGAGLYVIFREQAVSAATAKAQA